MSTEGLDEILAGARRRADLDHATCHELRHTCLTRRREAGMALEAVQAQAGHRSIESTRIYLHLTNDSLAAEYQRAAALIDADTAAVADMIAVQEVTGRNHVGRIVRRVGRAADVDVHPRQLRHTLATQAINRGMRLEAIAALLGHRKMEMTLIYARIANRVVADEYAAVSAKIDTLYGPQPELPANYELSGMAKLRREVHARMLGNGLCTRPVDLDCRMESACETCSYFSTSPEFRPTLERQRNHATAAGQTDRAALFIGLITRLDSTGT